MDKNTEILFNKIDKKMDKIILMIETLDTKITKLESRVNELDYTISNDLTNECKKMGKHINFVENVYNNVKHPLGYVCEKVKMFTVGDNNDYSLDE